MLVEEEEGEVGEEVAGNSSMYFISLHHQIFLNLNMAEFKVSYFFYIWSFLVVVVVAVKEAVAYLVVYLVVEVRRRQHIIKIPNPATRNKNIDQLTKEVILGKKLMCILL